MTQIKLSCKQSSGVAYLVAQNGYNVNIDRSAIIIRLLFIFFSCIRIRETEILAREKSHKEKKLMGLFPKTTVSISIS